MAASQIEQIVDSLPRSRRPRLVRPAQFPLSIEREYVAEHRGLIQDLGAIIGETLIPRLEEIARLGGFKADSARLDQSPWRTLLQQIFGEMRGKWEFAAGQAERVAEDTAHKISDHNRRQINKQIRAAVGMDVFLDDTQLVDTMEQFATDNVSRIKTYPATIFPALQRIVANGYRAGLRANAIRDQIVDQLGVEESRAAFWARDQIGSLNGQLTKQRQEGLGIDEYIWRSSRDEAVRRTHRALEGSKQRWDDPPQVGKRLVHPGEDYNCRCTADPVIPGFENEKTSPKDVPRDPELVKAHRERERKRRERRKKKLLQSATEPVERPARRPSKPKKLRPPEPIVTSPVKPPISKKKRKVKKKAKVKRQVKVKPVVTPVDKPVPAFYSKDKTIQDATFDKDKLAGLLREASKPGAKVTNEQALEIRRQLNAVALKYGLVNHSVLRKNTGRSKFKAVTFTGNTRGQYVNGAIEVDKRDLVAAARVLSGKGTFPDLSGTITVFHENMHAHSPMAPDIYNNPVTIGIEEATTELAAVKMVRDVTARPARVSAYHGYIHAMEASFRGAIDTISVDYERDPDIYMRYTDKRELEHIMMNASIKMRRQAADSEASGDFLDDFLDGIEWPKGLFEGMSEADATQYKRELKSGVGYRLRKNMERALP